MLARRLALALLLALALAAPAVADLSHRKHSVDDRIAALRTRVAGNQARERVLRAQIAEVTAAIRALERRVGDVSVRYDALRRDLYLHEVRLAQLRELYRLQSQRLVWLREQYRLALRHLDARLRDLYEEGTPDAWDVVFSAATFSAMLEQLDYIRQIGVQDRVISEQVDAAREDVRRARERTVVARHGLQTATRTIAVRTRQVAQVRDALLSDRRALADRRSVKAVRLGSLTAAERADLAEIDALLKTSAELAAAIRAAQERRAAVPPSPAPGPPVDTTPSSSGLVWPAAGPVTSTFGWRWGRMHEGVDIGASYGSAIRAAASGTVIYAGWLGGYGNLVVIDHGSGLATAYAHQSQIAVGNGQAVAQGQVIGYVGSTGHSTGPHLHFEVRVNGAPADPLGYL